MIDPRTPVIVGTGQAQQRPDDPTSALEPVDLLARAVELADVDSGATASLARAADTVAVCDILSWRYPDPGALLARRLGAAPRATLTSTVGGNSPQLLLTELAAAIGRGEIDVAVLGGAECMFTRTRARRAPKTWLRWSEPDDPPCPRTVGDGRPGSSQYEMAHLALAPTTVYPLFETALRAAAARDVSSHQRRVAELWSGFSAVAAANPHAWSQERLSPLEIGRPAADNRIVCFPYLKRMCANLYVDQAAALLLCSYAAARAAHVPEDRLVFPLAGADATDHYFVTERWSLSESPAIRVAARAALAAIGRSLDDVDRFDLYSCFPSAVQIGMQALELDPPTGGDARPLTVTGGLAFAGGPGNNYSTHAIAAMVEACRTDPGSLGLVTALGWYVTKHSIGLYSTSPPPDGFRAVPKSQTQAAVAHEPSREPAGPVDGVVTVEATSVTYERDGAPRVAIVAGLTPDGRRALADTDDPDTMASMVAEPWEGRTVHLRPRDDVNIVA